MIASFRMYNVAPAAAAAWRALFSPVFAAAGLSIEIVAHAAPAPLDALWSDPRLCGAFMCGWPFVRANPMLQAIAAPVPSPARYGHLPRYCSEFLVREASGWTRLEDTFGQRFGWTAANSHSGFNAPRAHLAAFTTPARPMLFAEVRGSLGAPMQAIDALLASEVDVVALDSFYLDLCRRHVPEKLAALRCVATTAWTPIPLLVAAPQVHPDFVARLRTQLLSLHREPAFAPLLLDVLVERFVDVDIPAYGVLQGMAETARALGYTTIA